MRVERKGIEREDTVTSRDSERDSFSLGDERQEGRRMREGREGRGGVESRKANLTFISGILGFAP